MRILFLPINKFFLIIIFVTIPKNSSLNYINERNISKLLYNIALHIIYNRGSPWPGQTSKYSNIYNQQ